MLNVYGNNCEIFVTITFLRMIYSGAINHAIPFLFVHALFNVKFIPALNLLTTLCGRGGVEKRKIPIMNILKLVVSKLGGKGRSYAMHTQQPPLE